MTTTILSFLLCSFAEPASKHTGSVDPIEWDFSSLHCGVSTEHSRRSRNQYWLVYNNAVNTTLELQTVLIEQGFGQTDPKVPAVQWAKLALCVQNFGGYTLLEQVDVDSFAQWIKLKHVHPPILAHSADKTTLSFWVYESYRGVPTFYKHTITMQGKDITKTLQDGLTFPRLPQ